jgi:hypothetical protein
MAPVQRGGLLGDFQRELGILQLDVHVQQVVQARALIEKVPS